MAIEKSYTAFVLRRSRLLHKVFMEYVKKQGLNTKGFRQDAQGDLEAFLSIITRIKSVFGTPKFSVSVEEIRSFGRRLGDFADRRLGAQIRKVVPKVKAIPTGNVKPLFEEWVADNVALIKTIDSRYFADIEKTVTEAFSGGVLRKDLTKEFQERYAVAKSIARRIARDQTAKMNSRLQRNKQESVGITQYTWRTSRDERVREEHENNEGQVFYWSSPPATGHPGDEIQCRCTAEPVLDSSQLAVVSSE